MKDDCNSVSPRCPNEIFFCLVWFCFVLESIRDRKYSIGRGLCVRRKSKNYSSGARGKGKQNITNTKKERSRRRKKVKRETDQRDES